MTTMHARSVLFVTLLKTSTSGIVTRSPPFTSPGTTSASFVEMTTSTAGGRGTFGFTGRPGGDSDAEFLEQDLRAIVDAEPEVRGRLDVGRLAAHLRERLQLEVGPVLLDDFPADGVDRHRVGRGVHGLVRLDELRSLVERSAVGHHLVAVR